MAGRGYICINCTIHTAYVHPIKMNWTVYFSQTTLLKTKYLALHATATFLFFKKIHFDNFLNRTSSKGGWFYRRESKIRSMHDLEVQFFFLSIKLKAEANGRGGAHASDPNNVGTSLVDTTCHPLE